MLSFTVLSLPPRAAGAVFIGQAFGSQLGVLLSILILLPKLQLRVMLLPLFANAGILF